MPRRSIPLRPGSLQSREQLLALGMSTRRLRGGELTRVLPDHYTPTAAPASLNDLCRLLQGTIIPGAVISHSTAAALLGMPLPWWFDGGVGTLHEHGEDRDGVWVVPSSVPAGKGRDDMSLTRTSSSPAPAKTWTPPPLHCSAPRNARRSAGPHAVVHRGRPGAWVLRTGGLLLSHPVDVVCQLAAALDLDDLVILLDHLIGPSSPIPGTTASDIDAFLRERPSSRGRPAVGAALRLARPHAPHRRCLSGPADRCGVPGRHPSHGQGPLARRRGPTRRPELRGLEHPLGDGTGHREAGTLPRGHAQSIPRRRRTSPSCGELVGSERGAPRPTQRPAALPPSQRAIDRRRQAAEKRICAGLRTFRAMERSGNPRRTAVRAGRRPGAAHGRGRQEPPPAAPRLSRCSSSPRRCR